MAKLGYLGLFVLYSFHFLRGNTYQVLCHMSCHCIRQYIGICVFFCDMIRGDHTESCLRSLNQR